VVGRIDRPESREVPVAMRRFGLCSDVTRRFRGGIRADCHTSSNRTSPTYGLAPGALLCGSACRDSSFYPFASTMCVACSVALCAATENPRAGRSRPVNNASP
jgi:hypothetical protein